MVPSVTAATRNGLGRRTLRRRLAIGDVGRSHLLDLAIGSPGERAGEVFSAGSAFVVYGEGDDGLDPGTGEKWTQASTGILDGPEAGDRFGARLTGGDYNGDTTAVGAISPSGSPARASCRPVAVPPWMRRVW